MSDQAMKQASRLKKWAGLVLLYTGNDIECPALMKYYTLGLLGAKQKLIWQKLKTKRNKEPILIKPYRIPYA